jgi:hypothetical protein
MFYFKVLNTSGKITEVSISEIQEEEGYTIITTEDRRYYSNWNLYKYINGDFEIITNPLEIDAEYLIIEDYRKKEVDGCAYFEKIRAKLVIEYKSGIKTAEEIIDIETRLESVTLKLKAGDWMTASFVMINTSVDGSLDQDLYDEILNYINDYITNNY